MGITSIIAAPKDIKLKKTNTISLSEIEKLDTSTRTATKEWAAKMITVKEQEMSSLQRQLSLYNSTIQESLSSRISIGTTKATALNNINQVPINAIGVLPKGLMNRPIEKKPEERISNYDIHVSTVVKQRTEQKIKEIKSEVYTLKKISSEK